MSRTRQPPFGEGGEITISNMKTKIKILFLVILCLPILSQAQVSQNLSKRFPAHIVYKIADVVSKINLTEDKQIKIGQKLFTADSLATISLANGKPSSKLKSYYTIDTPFLKPILSQKELDDYGYEMDKDNRYLVALKFASELKLEPTQISEIRKQNDSLDAVPKISSKKTIWIYNNKLFQILSEKQYVLLLKIIYKEQSMEDAKKDWDKIIKLKLITDENDKTEFIKILKYHMGKDSFLDKKAEQYEKTKIDFMENQMALGEPLLLVHANILSDGTYIDNKYSSVIKYEKELELTKSQTDTLLLKYRELEFIRFDNKEKELTHTSPKPVPSEYENITKILTADQVQKWLLNKKVKEAKRLGFRNWEQLQVEGLTKDLDKDKTLTELSVYQLQYLVSNERTIIYNTQEALLMKWNIEQKKPELLKQLDALVQKNKNTNARNILTW